MSGTTTPPPDDLEATYRQLLQQTVAPPAVQMPQGPTASSHEGRGFLSLLGEALGGGQEYGTTAERESGGLRALGAMGQRMLAASDYSYQPHTLGAIIGQGMGGASESLAGTQSVSAARATALQDYQEKQQQMQLARVKEAIPILTQLQTLRQAAAMRQALSGTPGTTPGTSIAAAGDGLTGDKAHDLPIIAQRESGGDPTALNYVAKADPSAYDRGATASGKYQIVNSTWREGMQLAGLDPAKYATARAAPVEVQDQVASALFDKYGNKPWQKGSTDWVKGEGGQYTLQPVKPPAAAPGSPSAPAVAGAPQKPPPASTPPPAVAAVPGGGGPLTPPGAPQPSPTGAIAEATRGAEVGPQPLPATAGKATPLPAGNLQTTGKPPGVAGNVEALQAGVNLAQATPVVPGTGLAAGPPGIGQPATLASVVPGGGAGFAPAAAPPAVVAPQAATQQPSPPPAATPSAVTAPALEPFVYNRGPLPASIQSKLDHPEQFVSPDLLGVQRAALAGSDVGEMLKAKAAVGAAADTVRAEAAKEAEAYHTNERNKQQEYRQKQIDAQQAIQLKQIEADNGFRMKEEEGRQQRLTSTQAADIGRQEKRMEAIETAGGASRSSLDDLDMLRALSNSVGTASPWSQIEVGGRKIQDWMTRFQIGSPESLAQMGNQQAYEAVVNKIIVGLRSGVSMGNLSDKDLGFIRDQAPSIMQDPKTRGNIIGFLEQVYQRKLDYAQTVSKYYRPGTTSVAEAEAKADQELGPILKQVPRYGDLTGDAQRNAKDLWIYQNIRPGTFYKSPGGKLVPYNPPPGWQPVGAEAD